MRATWKPLVVRAALIVGASLGSFASCSEPRHLVAMDEEAGNGGTPADEVAAGGVDEGPLEPSGGYASVAEGGAGAVAPSSGGRVDDGGAMSVAGTTGTAGESASIPPMPTAQTIVTATQQPAYLQLDDGFGYFSDAAGRVRRVALPDGTAIEELGTVPLPATPPGAPPLAVHGATAYVAASPTAGTFTIAELPSDGGTPLTFVSAPAWPTAMAVDDTSVYFAAGGNVLRVTIAGKVLSSLATGQGEVSALALDASNVYWASATMGSVNTVPIAGGTPTPLATSQTRPAALVLDADNAYWISQNDSTGSVMSVAIGGGTPTPLASAQIGPLALALSGSDAYFTNQNGTVMKVPLDGSAAPALVASGQAAAKSIVVDSDQVYWINGINGGIMTLPL